ncbi:hypothetical protein [Thioclava dalianensis]|nr:hypothetical protein [Thioclava dalianensis]
MTLFLVVMMVLAMFGKLRVPGRKGTPRLAARCQSCKRPLIGRSPCACKQGKR